jgi:hypothetical protein
MARKASGLSDKAHPDASVDGAEVIPLGTDPPPPPPERTSRPRGLHGLAIACTAGCALIAIFSFIAFVTVRWPGNTGRVVEGILLFSIAGLIGSMAASVLTAARATYVTYRPAEQVTESPARDGSTEVDAE